MVGTFTGGAHPHEGKQATADLATQRLHIHEKTAWMLRATAA